MIEITKKEIYTKYKKVWNKLIDYLIKSHIKYLFGYDSLPFSIFYAVLGDFFEENGIYINVHYDIWSDKWIISIIDKKNKKVLEYKRDLEHTVKIEAQQAAILKACEILEVRL